MEMAHKHLNNSLPLAGGLTHHITSGPFSWVREVTVEGEGSEHRLNPQGQPTSDAVN